MDIVEFIGARLDDDERQFEQYRYKPDKYSSQVMSSGEYWHIEMPHPRWLIEVRFKRALLERDRGRVTINPDAPSYDFGWDGFTYPNGMTNAEFIEKWTTPYISQTLRDLAAIYRDHPDYNEEWE